MDRRLVFIFIGFLIVYGAFFYALYDHFGGYYLYLTGFMWSPGLAALSALKLSGRDLSSLGWRWGHWRYQIEAYLVPILYISVSYAIIWGFGLGGFPNEQFVVTTAQKYGFAGAPWAVVILVHALFTLTFGVITYVGTSLGEEIGWRGFLVPELAKRFSFTGVALISGLIWAAWHFPLFLIGSPIGRETLVPLGFFTLMVIALSFILTWLRLESGSLWTAVVLHATHNYAIQRVATPLTSDTGNTAFFIDETGLVLPLVLVAFAAAYILRQRMATTD